jgi:hypothetical protein
LADADRGCEMNNRVHAADRTLNAGGIANVADQ